MANPQILAQLRDIHVPEPVSWWPLAPGWYGLFLLLLILFSGIFFFGRRIYRNGHPRRKARRLLISCEQQYQLDGNVQKACICVSELLKRVALIYFPRQEVASLQGEAWVNFLNRTARGVDFCRVRKELLELPYAAAIQAEKIDLKILFRMSKSWIKQRRGHV